MFLGVSNLITSGPAQGICIRYTELIGGIDIFAPYWPWPYIVVIGVGAAIILYLRLIRILRFFKKLRKGSEDARQNAA